MMQSTVPRTLLIESGGRKLPKAVDECQREHAAHWAWIGPRRREFNQRTAEWGWLLAQVKDQIGYGNFMPFLKSVEVHQKTANRAMSLARACVRDGCFKVELVEGCLKERAAKRKPVYGSVHDGGGENPQIGHSVQFGRMEDVDDGAGELAHGDGPSEADAVEVVRDWLQNDGAWESLDAEQRAVATRHGMVGAQGAGGGGAAAQLDGLRPLDETGGLRAGAARGAPGNLRSVAAAGEEALPVQMPLAVIYEMADRLRRVAARAFAGTLTAEQMARAEEFLAEMGEVGATNQSRAGAGEFMDDSAVDIGAVGHV